MIFLKEIKEAIKTVGVGLYICVFTLVFLAGSFFGVAVSDNAIFLSGLLPAFKIHPETLKYIYGPIVGVLLAFLVNFLKEKKEKKAENKKELEELMLKQIMYLNDILALKIEIHKHEKSPMRFMEILQTINMSVPNNLISISNVSSLSSGSNSVLAHEVLVSQDSLLSCIRCWISRDELYAEVIDIYTNKNDTNTFNATLLEFRNVVGGNRCSSLYAATELGIELINSTFDKLNESLTSVISCYTALGYANKKVIIPDELSKAIIPPKIESVEHLVKLLHMEEHSRKSNYKLNSTQLSKLNNATFDLHLKNLS